jgi:hypothetical protein
MSERPKHFNTGRFRQLINCRADWFGLCCLALGALGSREAILRAALTEGAW